MLPAAAAALILFADAVVFTAGELWLTAGGWALTLAFSPPDLRLRYMAVFNFGQAAVTIVAPSVAGWLIVAGKPGWLAAAGVFAVVVPLIAVLPITPAPARQEQEQKQEQGGSA
jgi:dipeptide/tripeptide permease